MAGDVNILITFYSRDGSTERLAVAIAGGAVWAGANIRLRRVRDFVADEIVNKVPGWRENRDRMHGEYAAPTEADAEWADGIILGTPTRFGAASAELKAYIDSLGGLWFRGRLNGKAGAAFTSTSTTHGGNESTLLSLYNPMAHLGLILVPLGYGDPIMFQAGTPYGTSTVSGQNHAPPAASDIEVAHYQGRRVTEVARALRLAGLTQQPGQDTKQG